MGSSASKQRVVGTVTELRKYPLKSGRGMSVDTVEIGETGIVGDREFVVADDSNNFMSQRKKGAMAKLELQRSSNNEIVLKFDGSEVLRSSMRTEGASEIITVWGNEIEGIDQGPEVALVVQKVLGARNLRLFWAAPSQTRPVEPGYAVGEGHVVKYADGYPFLLTTTASLADLNARMDEEVPMDRFRPNIVVDGVDAAWEEDDWKKIVIGGVQFQVCKKCSRCKMPTIDQSTGEVSSEEPVKTLRTFRAEKGSIFFGQNLVHDTKSGQLSVGDQVILVK